MKILLVEDSSSDREVLRYFLEAQFQGDAEIYEAATITKAIEALEAGRMDCIILDLQLPDSIGKETFEKLYGRFPDTPIIVMTHSNDRELALEMIRQGAADFIIKSHTTFNEEDLFRRITFAVEKHLRSVRVPIESAGYYHKLERAKSNFQEAQKTEDPSQVRLMAVEVTAAVADLSSKMFAELQRINLQLAQQEPLVQTVQSLDRELLRGYSDRPSMRSQVDLLEHRLTTIEEEQKEKDKKNGRKARTNGGKVKIILAIISLVGILGTAIATYFATIHKTGVKHETTMPTSR
jgi:DNA-binding NarL/FixJ family response regulator